MLISIVTAVFNAHDTIEDTIKSVLAQTCENIEYIIMDGGSTDGTLEIINKYKTKITRIVSEPDNGLYDAMNKGILSASGDIVGFLNADDMFYDSEVVSKIVFAFNNSSVDCVYGNLVYVSRSNPNRVTRAWKSRKFVNGLFEKSWTPAHPTFYCKKAIYSRLGYYNTSFKVAADVELMYRFLQINHIKSRFVDVNFVRMRDGGVSSQGIKSTIVITREMKKAITENGGRFNIVKYLFFKFFKIIEILKARGRK